jgi:hypothetical protein
MITKQSSDMEVISALETAGPILSADLIDICLERQDSLTPPLLKILADSRVDAWELTSDGRWFRGCHAGKFLIAYQEESALPLFAQIYASSDEQDLDLVEWFGTDLAYFSETAVSPLIQVLQTKSENAYHYGRAIAATTLKIIALQLPSTKDAVLAALRGELPASIADVSTDLVTDEMWTNVVIELADLQDVDSQTIVKTMYAADLIDEEMLPQAEYEASFAADVLPPPEVVEHFDIHAF